MPDNPFTREMTVNVTELVPWQGNLPECHAWLRDGARCGFKAKYMLDGRPICGVHLRPGAIFFPEHLIPVDPTILQLTRPEVTCERCKRPLVGAELDGDYCEACWAVMTEEERDAS